MFPLASAWTAAGAAMSPLSDLTDVALFVIFAAAIYVGTPDRAAAIAAAIGGRLANSAGAIDVLLQRAGASPRFVELLATLPARDGMAFVTDQTTCVACDSKEPLELHFQAAKQEAAASRRAARHPGALAAALQAKLGKSTNFTKTAADEAAFKELGCECEKEVHRLV